MLDIDIRPAGQGAAVVVMTRGTALLRALRGIGQRVVADIMTMRMAVEVVRRMTLAAIASQGDSRVGGRVMTGAARIMLLDVRRVDEVRVIDGLGMTAVTFGLQRDQGGVVLGGVGAEVTGDTTVTRATVVDRDADRAISGMTGGTGVMLAVVGRIHKASVIDRCTVTAGTTGGLRDQGRMVFGVVRPVAGHRAVDDDNFQVGPAVAELMNIPHISMVIRQEITDGKIRCTRTIDGGTMVLETELPALISTQRGLNEPRYPSLPGIMQAMCYCNNFPI